MRKTLFAILFTLMICSVLLCGCNVQEEEVTDQTDAAQSEEPTEAPTQKPDEATPYWKITGRYIKKYETRHFALSEDSARNLVLELSSDWTLNKTDNGYTISRDGEHIGSILMGSLVDKDWKIEKDYSRKSGNELEISKNIESSGTGSSVKYRYRYEYAFEEGGEAYVMSLVVKYEEIDLNAADRLYQNPKFVSQSNVVENSLSHIDGGNILILGNSFIGSSQVGNILNQIFAVNEKTTRADPISIGYANVGTYIGNVEIMTAIRNGEYDAVFICGFYSEGEADNLVVLEAACKESDTTLVIFPAHNEFEYPISLAIEKCPELPVLNWKSELDMLIESGVDKWDLCINDQHLHSTEYAGLIGAHMIYRSIYGEMPKIDGIYTYDFDVEKAKQIFGSYLETGRIDLNYEINYMN
ncbi:MAG: hypothetical protein J6L85_03675 [Clostridia bacterium]|nr:hypothetical protein [Clostridia bacterium]